MFVSAESDVMIAAVDELRRIASSLTAHNGIMSGLAGSIAPPAADPISAALASVFNAHAQLFQAVSNEAMAIHEEFAQTIAQSGASYAATEAANTAATG